MASQYFKFYVQTVIFKLCGQAFLSPALLAWKTDGAGTQRLRIEAEVEHEALGGELAWSPETPDNALFSKTASSQITHAHYCARTEGTEEDRRADGEEEPVREPLAVPPENPVQQRFAATKQTNPLFCCFSIS